MIRPACGLATAAVLSAVAATTGSVTAAGASAVPALTGTALVVTVTQAHGQMVVTPSTTLPAGRVTFNYSAHQHDHILQAAVLHPGYTRTDLSRDVKAGLEKGKIAAIGRLDSKVVWLGGTESRADSLGRFTTVLPAGTVWLFDQNSNAHVKLTVTNPAGTGGPRYAPKTVRATKHLHWHSPANLPKSGWINLRNRSTQPHVLVLQHVKRTTTAAQVRAFIKRGAKNDPPWALHATETSGVFSPGTSTQLHLRLPPGKYLLLCYWPGRKTGMPHFTMGMWKLVHIPV